MLKDVSDDENEDDDKENSKKQDTTKIKGQPSIKNCFISLRKLDLPKNTKTSSQKKLGLSWSDECLGKFKGKMIFEKVKHGDQEYSAGDYVYSQGNICQVIYFYEKNDKFRAHLKVFNTGKETLLGETADPHEVMDVMECSNVQVDSLQVILIKTTFMRLQQDFAKIYRFNQNKPSGA